MTPFERIENRCQPFSTRFLLVISAACTYTWLDHEIATGQRLPRAFYEDLLMACHMGDEL